MIELPWSYWTITASAQEESSSTMAAIEGMSIDTAPRRKGGRGTLLDVEREAQSLVEGVR